MSKSILIFTLLMTLHRQVITSQCPRQNPFTVNRQSELIERIQPPATEASTTLITDCTPSVCQNLANLLQLMVVCNLIQNTQRGSDLAVQLAAPIIKEVLSSPTLSCGCSNPVYPLNEKPYLSCGCQNPFSSISPYVNEIVALPNLPCGSPVPKVSLHEILSLPVLPCGCSNPVPSAYQEVISTPSCKCTSIKEVMSSPCGCRAQPNIRGTSEVVVSGNQFSALSPQNACPNNFLANVLSLLGR